MIIEKIQQVLNAAAKKAGYDEEFSVSFSNMPALCDFQCNGCFALAKKYGKAPLAIAEEIVAAVEQNDQFEFVAVKPAFINIKLTYKAFSELANKYIQLEKVGVQEHEQKMNVMFDYGGANVAKELHVGHLCSPIIGEGMKRLYKLLGHNAKSDAHLGDWGLQMGLTVLQLHEDGVLDYYFTGKGQEPEITLDMLNIAYPKASARKKEDEEFKKRADQYTKNIQDKIEPYYSIYLKIRALSIKTIEKLYKELGAEFDFWYGESSCDEYTDVVVDEFVKQGFARESEGALVVDVAREGEHIPVPKKSEDEEQRYKNPMPPAIIKKYNGGDLYATTDIATIYMRNLENPVPDEIFYYTDNRQNMHFEQVFRCCKMAGISPEGQKLIHIGFGTMNGKDGKPFKTREGTVVKLDDVINLLIDASSKKLASNGVQPTRELALKIGVGAMKFGALSNFVTKDYVFDIEKFLSFEGKTGPYLQYTVARINSILAKANEEYGQINIADDEQRAIIMQIIKLNSAYQICFEEKSLNSLCLATYDLASAFSTFYNNHHVLNEKDDATRKSYLGILTLVKKALVQALNVLAIEVPEKM
ncbi:MAG: arginine--tRNA ligase [Clostridia bacterium]|nr:arginine--tRNA ligase [Clostridia bacterium]